MTQHESHITTNHDEIQRWVEDRGGVPARVRGTGSGTDDDPGILRIDFPGHGEEEKLERISWPEFFEKFDQSNLAFLYQEELAGGETSRFFKFIKREQAHATH